MTTQNYIPEEKLLFNLNQPEQKSSPLIPNYNDFFINIPECNFRLLPHQQTLIKLCIQQEQYGINIKKIKELEEIAIDIKAQLADNPNTETITGEQRELMEFYEETNRFKSSFGVLADKSGTGKTLTILALLMFKSPIHLENAYSFGGVSFITSKHNPINHNQHTNLIFIQSKLFPKIRKYINMIDPINSKTNSRNLNYIFVNSKRDMDAITNNIEQIYNYNVVIVEDNYHNNISYLLEEHKIKIERVIYDNVDLLKLPANHCIKSRFKWFITSSPLNLIFPDGHIYQPYDDGYYHGNHQWRNIIHKNVIGLLNRGHIKDLFTNINNEYKSYKNYRYFTFLKTCDQYLQSSFAQINQKWQPDPYLYYIIECHNKNHQQYINGIITRSMATYIDKEDIEGAINCFNPNQIFNEANLIDNLKNECIEGIKNNKNIIENVRTIPFSEDPIETENEINDYIKPYQYNISGFQRILDNIDERFTHNSCSICFTDFSEDLPKLILKCCHKPFCIACIVRWFKQRNSNKCPTCKANVDATDLYLIKQAPQSQKDELQEQQHLQIEENTPQSVTNRKYEKYKNIKRMITQILINKPESKVLIFDYLSAGYTNQHSAYKLQSALNALTADEENPINYRDFSGNISKIKYEILDDMANVNTIYINQNSLRPLAGYDLSIFTDIIFVNKCDDVYEDIVINSINSMKNKIYKNIYYMTYI